MIAQADGGFLLCDRVTRYILMSAVLDEKNYLIENYNIYYLPIP